MPVDTSPEPFNASDPEQVKKQKLKAEIRDDKRRAVLQGLLAFQDGRDWIWGLLEATNVFALSFVQGDPYATAFREGERNRGLALLHEIVRTDPESFTLMMQEHSNG
jgi:hypothetical protein